MLDIYFDKVTRKGDIQPRQQISGSNKRKKRHMEDNIYSWDGKVTKVWSQTPIDKIDKGESYDSTNSFDNIK